MGNITGMTLREYIETGESDIDTLARSVGVSRHAIHKWIYGQRSPHLATALKIEKVTRGKVTLRELVKASAA